MSAAKQFRTAHDALMDDAHDRIQAIREEVDAELEVIAIKHFGPVENHPDCGFGPPALPVTVHCWHCDEKYSSAEMKRMYRPRMQAILTEGLGEGIKTLEPLWWCKDLDCDGAGLGHDIHVVRTRKPKDAKAIQ